jgi:hypothetical protein
VDKLQKGVLVDSSTVVNVLVRNDPWSWVNVVATFFAGCVALYAGIQAKKLLRVEIQRDRMRDFEIRKDQAKRISAWARPNINLVHNGMNFVSRGIEAVVLNQSEQAIYNVRVFWWFSEELEFESKIDLVPPGETRTIELSSEYMAKFSGDENFSVTYGPIFEAESACLDICDSLRIGISFQDAENRSWLRDQTGCLEQTSRELQHC